MKIINKKKKQTMDFSDLDPTDCFTVENDGDDELFMKTSYEQDAVSLMDGEYYPNMCGIDVYPVKTELHIV